jgi:hypothetical protein
MILVRSNRDSVSDPDSFRPMYPDPDSESPSRRAKRTQKIEKS